MKMSSGVAPQSLTLSKERLGLENQVSVLAKCVKNLQVNSFEE